MPNLSVVIDREKAAEADLTAREIADALHAEFGDSADINRFDWSIHIADLVAAANAKDPVPENLKKLESKNAKGEKVPLGSVVKILTTKSPPAVLRVNQHPAARVTAAAPDGRSVADTAAKCAEVAEAVRKELKLPDAFKVVNLTK